MFPALMLGIFLIPSGLMAQAPPPTAGCRLQLRVWLSPEVSDPRSPGFLSSLANRPGYSLTWLGGSPDDMSVTLELMGPGAIYRCREEVTRMRRDARVLSIEVAEHG